MVMYTVDQNPRSKSDIRLKYNYTYYNTKLNQNIRVHYIRN